MTRADQGADGGGKRRMTGGQEQQARHAVRQDCELAAVRHLHELFALSIAVVIFV